MPLQRRTWLLFLGALAALALLAGFVAVYVAARPRNRAAATREGGAREGGAREGGAHAGGVYGGSARRTMAAGMLHDKAVRLHVPHGVHLATPNGSCDSPGDIQVVASAAAGAPIVGCYTAEEVAFVTSGGVTSWVPASSPDAELYYVLSTTPVIVGGTAPPIEQASGTLMVGWLEPGIGNPVLGGTADVALPLAAPT